MTLADRLWAKVDKSGDCWLWQGVVNHHGYGVINVGTIAGKPKRVRRAHRVAYELTVGLIPDGMELDHLCRVRACCNPAHLEPVTRTENQRRGRGTHCHAGHPFDEANTYHAKSGQRMCRACHRERAARYRAA